MYLVVENPHKLDEFIDITKGRGLGDVLNYNEFHIKFSWFVGVHTHTTFAFYDSEQSWCKYYLSIFCTFIATFFELVDQRFTT